MGYPNPIRIENSQGHEIAIFSKTQVDIFGLPPDDLFPLYYVVERNNEQEYVQGFEEFTHCELIKKHRYVRYARFKRTLYNMLGDSNFKPKNYEMELLMLKTYLKPELKKSMYDQAKDILKHFNQPLLYRHIPTILNYLGYSFTKELKVDSRIVQNVLQDFQILNRRFDHEIDKRSNRKYFPNLKFIASKLLQKYDIHVPINFIRTKRKLKSLELSFNKLSSN